MIGHLLQQYPDRLRPRSPVESYGNAGGLSGATLWRFESSYRTLVLRMWPIDGPSRSQLRAIHRDLHRARHLDFVPVPFADRTGETILQDPVTGRFCELTPWMPGQRTMGWWPREPQIAAAFSGLAKFHRALEPPTPTMGPSPGLARRRAELERLIEMDPEEIRYRCREALQAGELKQALDWLDLAAPQFQVARQEILRAETVAVPLQRCLLDARPDHFLFTEDRLTGLVDYGAMDVDCVAADLARLRLEWLADVNDFRSLAIQSYESVRPLLENERRVIDVFEFANAVLGGWRWVEWVAFQGRRFPNPGTVYDALVRSVSRLEAVRKVRSASAGLLPG